MSPLPVSLSALDSLIPLCKSNIIEVMPLLPQSIGRSLQEGNFYEHETSGAEMPSHGKPLIPLIASEQRHIPFTLQETF